MNDISYIDGLADQAIMRQMGEYIKRTRIRLNMTQDELAERAAISRSTLSLLERGENTSVGNLIKVLRMLDSLYVLNEFRSPDIVSPLQLAKAEQAERKRSRSRAKGKSKGDEEDLGW